MTTVQHAASLSESTVQAIARGETRPARRRKRAADARQAPQMTRDVRVHPDVMAAAREALERGGYSRLVIIDERTVRLT